MVALSNRFAGSEDQPESASVRHAAPRRRPRRQGAAPGLAAMRRRIESYVSSNIDDPELSIDAIAATIGCSRRYLYKAFGSQPETLGEMIWRMRLERCARKLCGAAMDVRSITEIAFESGFNSSPHFSRLFRARYGMTARDWRKRRDPASPSI